VQFSAQASEKEFEAKRKREQAGKPTYSPAVRELALALQSKSGTGDARISLEDAERKASQMVAESVGNLKAIRDYAYKGIKYQNALDAMLGLYVKSLKLLKEDMKHKEEEGGYDARAQLPWSGQPYEAVPAMSTTKNPRQAVFYAVGEKKAPIKRRKEGVVGKILVYVMPQARKKEGFDILKMNKEHGYKTDAHKQTESEVTFFTEIPGEFLVRVIEIDAKDDYQAVCEKAKQIAREEAKTRYGGLKRWEQFGEGPGYEGPLPSTDDSGGGPGDDGPDGDGGPGFDGFDSGGPFPGSGGPSFGSGGPGSGGPSSSPGDKSSKSGRTSETAQLIVQLANQGQLVEAYHMLRDLDPESLGKSDRAALAGPLGRIVEDIFRRDRVDCFHLIKTLVLPICAGVPPSVLGILLRCAREAKNLQGLLILTFKVMPELLLDVTLQAAGSASERAELIEILDTVKRFGWIPLVVHEAVVAKLLELGCQPHEVEACYDSAGLSEPGVKYLLQDLCAEGRRPRPKVTRKDEGPPKPVGDDGDEALQAALLHSLKVDPRPPDSEPQSSSTTGGKGDSTTGGKGKAVSLEALASELGRFQRQERRTALMSQIETRRLKVDEDLVEKILDTVDDSSKLLVRYEQAQREAERKGNELQPAPMLGLLTLEQVKEQFGPGAYPLKKGQLYMHKTNGRLYRYDGTSIGSLRKHVFTGV
jgi:hypothetical protein